ncbi:hypothetical protein M3Y99_00276800 [Aphelenchoides fujianensis]|nr:hypothetical protein M3Y99_00276800 [Aphelenchoides fujianensis]
MFKILRRLTSRLLVASDHLERVKRADESGIPIVYLPLHKSHLDYVLMHWVLWHFGIRLPHVAAGDNLNMSGFGWCLRWIGAFFIKRHLSPNDEATKDLLYRAVLNQYLLSILKAGMSIEMLVEGTRSRFGKALIPKNGLISMIADAFKSGELPDCYLVPLSFTYDRVPEGIFHEELMGVRKPTESLLKVIVGAFRCVRARFVCGTVAVTFLPPVLLSKLKDIASTLPSLNYAPNQNSYRELLPTATKSVPSGTRSSSERTTRSRSVTALLAQLFLCKYRTQTIPLKRVAADLRALAAEVERLNYGDCLPYLEGTLEIVEGDRQAEEALVRMANERKAFITLAYHKNTALSPFRLISLAAIVTNLPQKNGTAVNPTKQMSVLCSFLRYELLTCPIPNGKAG